MPHEPNLATTGRQSYAEFLNSKRQLDSRHGFEPLWMPDFLFDFQEHLVEWAIRKGRAEICAGCGMGKTVMEFVFGENVVRKTNRPVLLLTPLAVAAQTVREAEKFGVDVVRGKDGRFPPGARIVVTNYDQLHKYNPGDFSGGIADEAGCIKDFSARRTAEVTEFFRTLPYRLLATALPAPNDFDELGTSAEALGELGYQDMLTRFFKKETKKDYLGWGRAKYQLKGHAERDFWRWVCSWARSCRKPSDVGPTFDDSRFILPALRMHEHVVTPREKRPGFLFDVPAETLPEQHEERRRTLSERCEKVAESVNGTGRPAVVWCQLNPEGDCLEKLIPDAVQVSGSDRDEFKEETFLAFASGQIRVLVTKPVIAAWGLNWQHCAHQTFFASHSFEQAFQGIYRCYRFGQTRDVDVDFVLSEGERGVMENMRRKWASADRMFEMLVSFMRDALEIGRDDPFTSPMTLPSWFQSEVRSS